MKLYAMPVSQPARCVMWACTAENTPFELVMTMPGSNKEGGSRHPDFLAKFPKALVPSMEDDGVYLSEAHAIMTYLAEKHDWSLYPKDPAIRGKIQEYLHWHHKNTREITLGLFAPVMRPDLGIPPEQVRSSQKAVSKVMQSIETTLSASKFLCGDSPTIADLAAYCEIGQCTDEYCALFDFTEYPSIRNWIVECKQIDGYAESHKMLGQLGPKIAKKAKEFFSKL